MLKKLLALLLIIGFVGQASAIVWDTEKLMTGRQMVPYGAGWYADDQIMYFGNDKDLAITYDETTSDRTELTATNGMYFDVGAVTFYSNDPANESLTFTGFYPVFGGGIYLADDQKLYFGDSGEGSVEYDEDGVNKVIYDGVSFLMTDDTKLEWGTDGDCAIEYDENGDNVAKVTGSFSYAEPIAITKAIGTAPMTITSTTKVTNLNADQLDDHDTAYFGTASNQTSQQTEIDACETNATTQQTAIDDVEAAYLSEMVINVPISAASVDQFVFVSDGTWTITSVKENHAVAGNDGSAVNFTVMICDDTEAPDKGLMVHNATCDLKATAKTIQEPALSGLAANVTVANNDSIAIDFQGNLATLAGGVITIEMSR